MAKDLYEELFSTLSSIGKKYSHFISSYAASVDCTYSEILLIHALGRRGQMVSSKLADETFMDKAALSRTIQLLIGKGYVEKGIPERTKIYKSPYRLTNEGKTLYRGLRRKLGGIAKKALPANLGEEGIDFILENLRKVDSNLTSINRETPS